MILYKEVTDNDSKILVNRIVEDASFYLQQIDFTPFDIQEVSKYLLDKRKIQWYASRYALKKLINQKDIIYLNKDAFGKPYIENSTLKISLSHTQHMVVAMSSGRYDIGVDIEQIKEKVLRIAHKFTTDYECQLMSDLLQIETLITIWSAKESIYKMYSQKQLDFKDHMIVEPFIYKGNGQLKVRLQKSDIQKQLTVHYCTIEDHIITYVEDIQQ